MKVGFIGLGNVFPLHLRAVRNLPDVEIVGCHDTHNQRLIAAQDLGLPVYRELPNFFAKKPDVIHVLVPPQHHVQVATFALGQGASCFLEKPAALSLQGIEELISASSLACKKAAVNHNQLFNPGFLRAVKMIRDRRIGALEHVHVHYELLIIRPRSLRIKRSCEQRGEVQNMIQGIERREHGVKRALDVQARHILHEKLRLRQFTLRQRD